MSETDAVSGRSSLIPENLQEVSLTWQNREDHFTLFPYHFRNHTGYASDLQYDWFHMLEDTAVNTTSCTASYSETDIRLMIQKTDQPVLKIPIVWFLNKYHVRPTLDHFKLRAFRQEGYTVIHKIIV